MTENSKGREKQMLGRFGEDKAADYLISEGFALIERNFRCRAGEIDIIASDSDNIIFAEVKLRKNDRFGAASEFVNYAKQRKIIKAAEYYLTFRDNGLQPRFDVIEVYAPAGAGGEVTINHIRDAFQINT